jgi:hypothetical protein
MRIRATRNRWAVAALAFVVAFGGWMLVASQRSHATGAEHALAPSDSHSMANPYSGKRKPLLNRPKVVRDRIAQLNRAFENCLAAHGATREDLTDGGYLYRADDSAAAACAGRERAINTYLDSDAYHASDVLALKLLKKFWDCYEQLPDKTDAAVEACRLDAANPQ